MRIVRWMVCTIAAFAIVAPIGSSAQSSNAALPNGAVGVTFHFSTTVQTPKGKKSANGTITIKQPAPQKLSLTVTSSDGSSQTIPLTISGGSAALDTSQSMPASGDPEKQAAAKALLSNMKVAAEIGIAAKKNAGKNFSVNVSLTPVGNGTAMPAEIPMKPSSGADEMVVYSGGAEAETTTQLPPSSGLDPEQLVKSVGVAVATHGFTPAGRAAVAIARHHQVEEQKEAASGELPDKIQLVVTSHFVNGRFHDISGTQTDSLTIGNKGANVVSTWSFTKAQ
jgi:hypothetical protein